MLRNIITPDVVKIDLESTEKEECFAELLELIVAKHPEINRKEALDSLIKRESKLSTAVAKDAAIPHALVETVPKVAIAVGISYMLSGYYGLYSSQKIVYSKLRAEYVNVSVK